MRKKPLKRGIHSISELAIRELNIELTNLELLSSKIELLYYCSKLDDKAQIEIISEIETQIAHADLLIATLINELSKEKCVVKNKCEYEKIASEIDKYQTKDELMKLQHECLEATEAINNENKALESAMECRKKQAQLLTGIFEEFRSTLPKD